MRRAIVLFVCLSAVGIAAVPAFADSAPVALLSVATGVATLDVARPESQRPVVVQKPLPYAESFIRGLRGPAQKHALEENERVAAENERAAEIAVVASRETRDRREAVARRALGGSDLGRAVLRVPEFFSAAATNGLGLVLLRVDGDGFVVGAPEDARLVRMFFDEPRFNPPPPPLPAISNDPIRASMSVTLKVESPSGETVLLETFEQTATARNPDALVGSARKTFLETLVKAAVSSAAARIANPAVQSAPKESRKP